MSICLFADNASSILASGIASTDLALVVSPGDGALFSAPGAGQFTLGTLEDASGNIEIVRVTSRTTDSFVIVRAQEGTTARAFASGTRFEQRVTAGMLQLFLQKAGGDTMSGTTILSGVLNLGGGGSIQGGELAGTAIRSQPADTSNQILVPVGTPATAAGSVILTKANLLSQLPNNAGMVISGMVLYWSGLSTNIPAGYLLCDGTVGTPDLRDKFVLGGGGALPTSGGTNTGATGPGGNHTHGGATAAYVLQIADIPSHTHNVPSNQIGKTNGGQQFNEINSLGAGTVASAATGGGGGHAHGITASGDHTHTITLPPYRALFAVMKA